MAPIKYCCASGCYSTTGLQQFPAASGNQADKSRRKAWIEAMRRHMNDKNWQLTRNLYVCAKHFSNGDTINGIPDFGPSLSPSIHESSSAMDLHNPENEQESLTMTAQIPIQGGSDLDSGHVEVEEIEVDASDWLPKTVSHQFKEQFIGNDPRYVAIVKDNIVMQIPAQEMKKSNFGQSIFIDELPTKTQVLVPDGKENTMLKDNIKVEAKKFIQTETGEMYEILSIEEPQENLEMQNITKVGCNTYLYNTTNITQSEETSSHNNETEEEMDEIDTHAKRIKLDEPRAVAIVNQSSVLSDHNTFKQAKIGINSSSLIYCAPGRKAQKRSASHMKTLDTNLDVDHSFDFVRTLSAENIKLQEANVRLREADGKRVHEHACLQKKVKRMERERMQLLNGLEESGFTDAQIEFIKRKGVAETQEDQASASHSLKNYHWGRETLGRAIRMRLILGTMNYNYMVRLGLPLPPEVAIDDHITKIEKEIEEEDNSTSEEVSVDEDKELVNRIINEENAREEHLKGHNRHNFSSSFGTIQSAKEKSKTSDKEKTELVELCGDQQTSATSSDLGTLKQMCENDNLSDIPGWFAKSKDVRLHICFPNAFDPKYLMARRKLFKQMKILKEEQQALKNKSSSAVIKLTPCAPPSFAKNVRHLKFKPIKGHVLKPAQKSDVLTSETSQDQSQSINNLNIESNLKSTQIPDEINKCENEKTTTTDSDELVVESETKIDIVDVTKPKEIHDGNESQEIICDIQEEGKTKNRRSRRRV